MRILLAILVFLSYLMQLYATHNRAGQIRCEHISGYKYRIILETFTYIYSPANITRDYLEIQWGDNTSDFIPRVEQVELPDEYLYNRYEGEHTFPGPGIYRILMADPCRNEGINNIPSSVYVIFSVSTTLKITTEENTTPVFMNPPTGNAALNLIYIYNSGATDPDGDSLAYHLTICTQQNGDPIPNYTFPPASNYLKLDSITGDFIWDAPTEKGKYNIALVVEEWRNGYKISETVRDIQIVVDETDNNPPVIQAPDTICVTAGDIVNFCISATDPDGDIIELTVSGGPFMVDSSSAIFYNDTFYWQTNCTHVQKQAHIVNVKARDNNSDFPLMSYKQIYIYVHSAEPKNLFAEPTNNTVFLSWDTCLCEQAKGYYIFRKTDSIGFIPDSCETGVPSYTGYVKIGTVNGFHNTNFLDNNNNQGLTQGYIYCYMVDAFFNDGAESFASLEECTPLVRGIPVITNVSINNTDYSNGAIYLAWAKPIEFDSTIATGPYRYLIYRSTGLWGENLVLIDSLNNINDTTYIDTFLNTHDKPYSYKIEFYNVAPGNRFLIGTPQVASSVFLDIQYGDNKLLININKNVPWINNIYEIYRKNLTTGEFELLNTTNNLQYIDSNLVNEQEYCYKVKSIGGYDISGIVHPIINYSQQACATPKDTVAPCPPVLSVVSNCDSLRNELSWTNPNKNCCDDVIAYNIYYSPLLDQELKLIATLNSPDSTSYIHYPTDRIAGCYAVTAVDSFMNESSFSNKVCLDKCEYYQLPNTFTPNGDGINDVLHPGPYYFVEKVDMKIYNRWGELVFETNDPDINWDGRYLNTNKLVSPGVYYYICNVYERRITGIVPRYLVGFIHIFTDKEEYIKTKP